MFDAHTKAHLVLTDFKLENIGLMLDEYNIGNFVAIDLDSVHEVKSSVPSAARVVTTAQIMPPCLEKCFKNNQVFFLVRHLVSWNVYRVTVHRIDVLRLDEYSRR